jgi:VIT1/CCC1 family predicted Fe2+/Mn2+ transporter
MGENNRNGSGLIKDIIIGMSDGLTVPFALTASLSGILNTNHLIIVSGMAEIAAGCISMGLGGYLAGESEIDRYNKQLKREYHEIETVPHLELKEVEDALIGLGVELSLSQSVALQISKNKDNWANFMMQVELKLEKPVKHRGARKRYYYCHFLPGWRFYSVIPLHYNQQQSGRF